MTAKARAMYATTVKEPTLSLTLLTLPLTAVRSLERDAATLDNCCSFVERSVKPPPRLDTLPFVFPISVSRSVYKLFIMLCPSLEFVRMEPVYGIVNGTVVELGYIVTIGRHGSDSGKLLNSLFVSSATAIVATVLGLLAAFVMSRYGFPGKPVFGVLMIVPLLSTPLVNGYVIGRVS